MSACLRCLLKSKLEVGEPQESNSDPNPEKREGREKEEELGVLSFFPVSLMVFTSLIKVSTLNVFCYLWAPFVLSCYKSINSRWPSVQSSCLSRYLFYSTLLFENLMLLFSACIGATCCHLIPLQSRAWEDFAEGIWISVGFKVPTLCSIGFYGQI